MDYNSIQREYLDACAGRQREPTPLPDVDDLRTILNTALVASRMTEEGRQVAFRLVVEPKPERLGALAKRFSRPIPYTRRDLVKLAPAFSSDEYAFILTAAHGIALWGVLHEPHPFRNQLRQLPQHAEPGMQDHSRSQLLIHTVRPGVLGLAMSTDRPFLFLSDNAELEALTVERADPVPVYFRNPLKAWLWGSIPEAARLDWLWSLDYLITEIARRGHGATLIVLPPDAQEPAPGLYYASRTFADTYRAGYAVESINHLDFLAQLATVDGALIISDKFELHGFAAKLKVLPVDYVLDGHTQKSMVSHGMRHNSGAGFASACSGAFVFVLSADGPLSIFHRPVGEDDVRYWHDALLLP